MSLLTPSQHRRRPVGGSDVDFENELLCVSERFGKEWLELSPPVHRVQRAWHRDDWMASLELASLGHALDQVIQIDPKWVKETVRKIKRDSAASHGPLFELLAISMLASAGMRIRPMRGDHPAYDAEVQFENDRVMRLSMKNHDVSDHERNFRKRCAEMRDFTIASLRRHRSSAHIVIRANTHLTEGHFAQLKSVIATMDRSNPAHLRIGSFAEIHVSPVLQTASRPLDPSTFSDTFAVIALQHPNEQKKFLRKIGDAQENMGKGPFRSAAGPNIVFMRLHDLASIAALERKARELLAADEECHVHAIWLYQPSVARSDQQTHVLHMIKIVNHPDYDPSPYKVALEAPYGRIGTEPSQMVLKSSGNGAEISLDDSYVYQRGEHFVLGTRGDSQIVADLSSPAPGVRTNLSFDDGGRAVSIRGKFPEQEELLIL